MKNLLLIMELKWTTKWENPCTYSTPSFPPLVSLPWPSSSQIHSHSRYRHSISRPLRRSTGRGRPCRHLTIRLGLWRLEAPQLNSLVHIGHWRGRTKREKEREGGREEEKGREREKGRKREWKHILYLFLRLPSLTPGPVVQYYNNKSIYFPV